MSTPTEATFIETRLALQSLAEHVLSAARHRATGRIGLRPAPGGFTTPAFPTNHGDRVLAVDGLEVVRHDDRGEVRRPITTVGAAAELAEVAPGAATDVFTPTTALEPEAPLAVDAGAAAAFAAWWALADEALTTFRSEHADEDPAPAQLWPEHFDLGCQVGEVNYGASPGDAGHQLPYLYVGPWSPPEQDDFWNRPFGALVPAVEIPTVDAALAFFRAARTRLDAIPTEPPTEHA